MYPKISQRQENKLSEIRREGVMNIIQRLGIMYREASIYRLLPLVLKSYEIGSLILHLMMERKAVQKAKQIIVHT